MLPEGWISRPLEQIAKISSGGTPSRANAAFWGGNIPWVTTAEVNSSLICDTKEKITQLGLENSSAKLYQPGTILLAMYGQGKTRGQVAMLGIQAATNQACAAIVLKQNFNRDFYFYYLQSRYEHLRELSNSGSQENLSAGLIKEITVPIPPPIEQARIAKVLATWDKAMATVERLLKNSQYQKKALTQQLLTGKKRLHGFQREWQNFRLEQIFSRVTTKNTAANTNVVTISAQHGLIRQEDYFNKTVASETLDNYFLLKKGQFAYNKSYSNGYPMGAIKRLNKYEKGVVTTLYICFEVRDESICNPEFFEHYFDSGLLNNGLSKVANEGGRAHGLLNVKPSDFFGLNVFIPGVDEQKAIAAVLTTADQEIQALQAKLACLKQEKIALMQQLFTGKRRVKVDEPEVA
ncbi:TPA: restriction endonuclease subunit S [Pseudomonas aeruginosa]